MKIKISKIDAAKSQILTAIHLFFEERDPVSIHTLIGAGMEIVHDHITDKGLVWDKNLILHPDTIYIKDEYRKEWQDRIRKDKNFFKHADRDIKKGITETEFDPKINEFYIMEAIRALGVIQPDFWPPEFKAFTMWFIKKNPKVLSEDAKDERDLIKQLQLNAKSDYKKAIDLLNEYPERFIKKA